MLIKHKSVDNLVLSTGISERRIRNYLAGETHDPRTRDRIIREISIDVVDRAIINEGSTWLGEVFPHLYD